jgi:hypothetical protein
MPARSGDNRRRLAAAIVCICMAITAAAWASTPAKSVQAIWRVQQLDFDYYSPSVSYTCDGLEQRIRTILLAVGAHESMRLALRCAGRTVNSAHVQISVAAPVEATDKNIRAATAFAPHEALAARVKGVALPAAADIESFAASWQQLSLSRLRLTNADCDLLRNLQGQVFPKLRIRSAKGFGCFATPTRIVPKLSVEALLPVQT